MRQKNFTIPKIKGENMTDYIIEKERKTKIKGKYDVFVAGGGIAGVTAALAAARHGAKVILADKQCILGGLATSGLITFFLAICDGEGRQVSSGMTEELLRLSVKRGPQGIYPYAWLHGGTVEEKIALRFETQFNASSYAIDLEKMLLDAGVKILYDTRVCDVNVEDRKINAVVVENKSGRLAYSVKSVIDATGDADIYQMTESETEIHKIGNVLCAWNYGIKDGKVKINMQGWADIPDKDRGTEERILLTSRKFTGLDGEEISEMLTLSHAEMLKTYEKEKEKDDSYEMNMIPTIPQLRMTRKIVGAYTIDYDEMHKEFSDSIGMVSDWRKPGPVFEIPFRTLYGEKIKNLISAGRCTSATDRMWDITRCIPCCTLTGQAAGIAAAMCDEFATLDVTKLQKKLTDIGVVLHEKDLSIIDHK